jgi:FkbM family methyltransferase
VGRLPLCDAIGDENGTTTLNVAANAGGSSSILPMLSTHFDAAPEACYVGTEDAEIRTLDSLAPEILRRHDKVFLKADVQGYEKFVIAGAKSTLSDYCVGLQLELSLVPLSRARCCTARRCLADHGSRSTRST